MRHRLSEQHKQAYLVLAVFWTLVVLASLLNPLVGTGAAAILPIVAFVVALVGFAAILRWTVH